MADDKLPVKERAARIKDALSAQPVAVVAPQGMVLSFRGTAFSNPGGLINWLGQQAGAVKLRPDHKLAVVRDMPYSARLKAAKDIVSALQKIAAAGR